MQRTHQIWAGIMIGVAAGTAVGVGGYSWLAGDGSAEASDDVATPLAPERASHAFRLAGLDALERGDHDAAIREFSAGLRAPDPAPDLPRLLSLAHSMRERDVARQEQEASARAFAEASAREPPAREPEPMVAQPTLLLVTSRPASLAVEVNGKVRDMTPARIDVGPGRHKVVVRRGADRLAARTIRLKSGEVSRLDLDLTEAIAALDVPAADKEEAVNDAYGQDDETARPGPAETSTPLAEGEDRDALAPRSDEPDRALLAMAAGSRSGTEPSTAQETPRPPTEPPAKSKSFTGFSAEDVRRASARVQPQFQICYHRHLDSGPELEGRIVMRTQVDADGAVMRARVLKSTIENAKLERCLSRAARRMRFPRPATGPTAVTFSIKLKLD